MNSYRVSKKIMDLHNGLISVSSEGQGCGCNFEIALDVINPSNNAVHMSNKVAPAPLLIADGALNSMEFQDSTAVSLDEIMRRMMGLCVLIVDDSRVNRKFTTRLLSTSNYGMNLLEAEDGLAAIEMLRNLCPVLHDSKVDVVLMDNRMPRMDGLTTTRELRALGYRGVIIGVTGDAQEDDIKLFKSSGADAVLSKPITFKQLERCLMKCLRESTGGQLLLPRYKNTVW